MHCLRVCIGYLQKNLQKFITSIYVFCGFEWQMTNEIFEFDDVVFEEWWMDESWIIFMKYWVRLVIKKKLKNREHEKTKYEIQLYEVLWNILWEYEFF